LKGKTYEVLLFRYKKQTKPAHSESSDLTASCSSEPRCDPRADHLRMPLCTIPEENPHLHPHGAATETTAGPDM